MSLGEIDANRLDLLGEIEGIEEAVGGSKEQLAFNMVVAGLAIVGEDSS